MDNGHRANLVGAFFVKLNCNLFVLYYPQSRILHLRFINHLFQWQMVVPNMMRDKCNATTDQILHHTAYRLKSPAPLRWVHTFKFTHPNPVYGNVLSLKKVCESRPLYDNSHLLYITFILPHFRTMMLVAGPPQLRHISMPEKVDLFFISL